MGQNETPKSPPTESSRAETLLIRNGYEWTTPESVDALEGPAVALTDIDLVAVRNLSNPEGPALLFTQDQWRTFVTEIREKGTFDKYLVG